MTIHNPMHPGVIVHEILIKGANLSVTAAAERLEIDRSTLSRLLNGHSGISPEMALRLSILLPDSDITLWLNLQRDYDIWVAKKRISKIHIKPLKAA